MTVISVSSPLALAAVLTVASWGIAQPAAPEAPTEAPPPHVLRLEGEGAQVQREGSLEPLAQGDPVLYGDRVDTASAYVQLLWGDGTRVGLDRGSRVEALSPELLALTAGRLLVTRPAATTSPLRLDTPAASLVLAAGGEYRVSIEAETTTLAVTRGRVDVQSGMGEQVVAAGQQVALRDGLAPEAPRRFNAAGYDSFVQWATAPAPTPTGGAPLDTFADPRFEAYADVFNRNGTWESDPQFGAVWFPTVGADWRPYADGFWQPWGAQSQWLWVGRDPWGWPTHHFGRWSVNQRGRWFWAPGRQWAPAWVSWSVGPGFIGWTPLGLRDQPLYAWDEFSRQRGRAVYPSGTLDPSRAWTVVPSDRFGRRDRLGAYAVDPRTLDNLSAFVSQRVGPPVRYGVPGGVIGGPGVAPGPYAPFGSGTTVYGPDGYYGGVRRTGDSTVPPRGPIGPTRVGPESPGYGGPTPPPEDPYERANRAVTPRGRTRVPSDTPAADPPASAAPRQRTPPRETPPAPREQPREAPPTTSPAPPRAESTPPPSSGRATGSTGRASGESTGRRAVPRP